MKSKPEARRIQPPPTLSDDELAAAALGRALRPSGFLARLPPLTDQPCLHVGIDENGLGPVLGPMIVTGVAFRLRGPRPTSLGVLVGDSKALVSHADVSLGEAWARALLAALGETPRSPADVIERLSMDLASSEYLQSFTFRLRGREKSFLDKIEKALGRIDDGTFGICEECGEEISVKRLEARPETTLCIRCKEDQERAEKDYG